jgi:hypothetical protein
MTTAEAIEKTLVSPHEHDRNLEAANVVDGLFAIARAIDGADLSTASFREIAKALNRIADLLEAKPYIPEALRKVAVAGQL